MFNLDIGFSLVILVLDLFGTVVFAVTGALRAIEHKYDIVGIIILATVTGILGGVMRDTILGVFPPNNFSDTIHIVLTTITAIVIFFLYHKTKKYENLFNIFEVHSFSFCLQFCTLFSSFAFFSARKASLS